MRRALILAGLLAAACAGPARAEIPELPYSVIVEGDRPSFVDVWLPDEILFDIGDTQSWPKLEAEGESPIAQVVLRRMEDGNRNDLRFIHWGREDQKATGYTASTTSNGLLGDVGRLKAGASACTSRPTGRPASCSASRSSEAAR